MAAPITHIALTEKIFDKFFKDKIRKDFFIGTSFPDIRYLKVIDRDKTHYNRLSITDLGNDESFLAGVKFHSILDHAREKFIVENDTYSLCPESKYITQSLKILEDEIFYQHVKDWNVYAEYLNEILQAERGYGITEKNLKKWHSLLQQYFQWQPDNDAVRSFMLGIDFAEEIADEINQNIAVMRANKEIIDIQKAINKTPDLPDGMKRQSELEERVYSIENKPEESEQGFKLSDAQIIEAKTKIKELLS
ncbi:MAG: hypothetical protein U9P61_00025 [Patescibacteria group bacterium]|nr:hypothetical protein [Patescibacteria group bacterium]